MSQCHWTCWSKSYSVVNELEDKIKIIVKYQASYWCIQWMRRKRTWYRAAVSTLCKNGSLIQAQNSRILTSPWCRIKVWMCISQEWSDVSFQTMAWYSYCLLHHLKTEHKTTRFIYKHTLWYPYDIVNVNYQCGRINTPWSTHTMMWVKPCDVPIILFFVSLRDYPFHSEVQCWDKYQHRVYWLEKKGSFAAFLLTRVHSYHKEAGLHCSGFIFHQTMAMFYK